MSKINAIKINIDPDTDEIISPETQNAELVNIISKFLSDSRFCHEGWIKYGFYRYEAAQHIVSYIEKYYEQSKE